MGTMRLHFISIAFTLAGIYAATACEINLPNKEVTFLFSEVAEDFPVNEKLPKVLPITTNRYDRNISLNFNNAHAEHTVAQEYIKSIYNENDSTIEFYLLKSLKEYRQTTWSPSIELEFTLPCSAESNIYTYMITIEDANLNEPKFIDAEEFTGNITYSLIHGFQIHLPDFTSLDESKTVNYLRVRDEDFNRQQHCNLVVANCSGANCSFFDFKIEFVGFERGNNFKLEIDVNPLYLNFNETIGNKSNLHFELTVSDGEFEATAKVNFDVSLNDEIGNRQPPGDDDKGTPFPTVPILSAGVVTGFVLVACFTTIVYQTKRNRKAKNLLRQLTEAEIREFLEGSASFSGNDGKRSVDVNTPIMAQPYNKNFEIARDKLRIDETTILGTGAFGIVWKGAIMYSNGDSITVAVKSVKRNVGVLYFKALLSELKIMAYIGKHPNIVSLVGACTHNIRKREVYIAVAYCANGNFHNYLRSRREGFANLVVDGQLQLTNSRTTSTTYSTSGVFSKPVSTLDLLKWATQIANGLQYLESLGVIHGDLATRNILLDSERVAKIGDFGLSRRLIDYSNYYYTKTSQAPLPWKWMAPESLRDMRFSKKSDIWSFGIVLWEIFTLGQTPYPGLNWDENFVGRLETGMRPSKPSFATEALYDVMADCWNLEPHDRPAILDMKRTLESMTSSGLRQRGSLSYMRFLGEQPFLSMLNEGLDGYLIPNHERENNSNFEDA